ncbi:MAG: 1-acyl-sn-glycerol-3-phosphate acyltransferase [Planctomycetes bacterium]|jgi:1-acyl-sn-glycerol-3-phosphate acyltransferase|nr:1-acyl-sn-glycerol-3-phosphate acyltransferase [Planctomycetota bacterium]
MTLSHLSSLVFLILCLASACAYLGRQLFGPGRYSLQERFLYLPVYVVSRLLWRVRIEWSHEYVDWERREWLLTDRMLGGAILVANHCSSMDPMFVQLCAGRRVHWMVTSLYFQKPIIGGLLRSFETIPTHRSGMDTASTKHAISLAKQGRFVGMFPEGRINRTGQPLMTIRPGAAIVALRAKVPIVPIWIEGAPIGPSIFSALFRAANIRVLVEKPNDWGLQAVNQHGRSDRSVAEEWIARVMAQAVVRSGRSDPEISFAGRHWVEETG